MKNKILIAIITSEKTWNNFIKFGMDLKIAEKRNNFDLAFVLNGNDPSAVGFYNSFAPDYFYVRENKGFDPAAITYLLSKIPVYEHTLIMHDDHWFIEDDWFEQLVKYAEGFPHIDIFGNILFMEKHFLFDSYCEYYKIDYLTDNSKFGFLHGISGIYSKRAITKLKEFDYLPYDNSDNKLVADVEERVYSAIFRYLKLKVSGFHGAVYRFFRHNTGNYRNSLFSQANYYYYINKYKKAINYYSEYLDYCEKINYTKDYGLAYMNLATSYLMINEKEKAKKLYIKSREISPNIIFEDKIYEKIPELRNYVR